MARTLAQAPASVSFLASLLAHALVFFAVAASVRKSATELDAPPDHWAAETVEVGTLPGAAAPQPTPAPAPEPTPVEAAPPAPAAAPVEAAPRAIAPPASSEAAPTSAPSPDAEASTGGAPGGSMGALGLPPGVRHFHRAFVRALANTHGDPAWRTLPLGPVGKALVSFEIDPEGHIARSDFDPEVPAPAVVRRMVDKTLILLRSGTFSLDPSRASAGVEKLEIDVAISQLTAPTDEGDPNHMHELGNKTPERGRPGRAWFTLNSGRHVEATVTVKLD